MLSKLKKYIQNSPRSGRQTCADPADVVEELVNGFSCQILQLMEGLQGQQPPGTDKALDHCNTNAILLVGETAKEEKGVIQTSTPLRVIGIIAV